MKRWLRQRYGVLPSMYAKGQDKPDDGNGILDELEDLDLYEYMFYNSVGNSMFTVMDAIAGNRRVCKRLRFT